MAFMEWNDSFSVNVAEIDEQHKKLIGMLNTFYDSIVDDKKTAFGDLLNSLNEYAAYHFATEEKYMDKFDYPDRSAHRREHELFAEKALDGGEPCDFPRNIRLPERLDSRPCSWHRQKVLSMF